MISLILPVVIFALPFGYYDTGELSSTIIMGSTTIPQNNSAPVFCWIVVVYFGLSGPVMSCLDVYRDL